MRESHQDLAENLILEMKGITKRFPGVVANDSVDFALRTGEIHALLGENGAGKSTLMRIAYGLYQPDSGEIRVDGTKAAIRSPQDALTLGIGMVHQHPMLIPTFTVAENVILGMQSSGPFLKMREARERIREVSEQYHLAVNPGAKAYALSMGEKQQADILKALYRGARILILDEPTSVLTPSESDRLMGMLVKMARESGLSVVFITHKLPQVMAISDRVTILRRGRVVDIMRTEDTSETELARRMVGRDIIFDIPKEEVTAGADLLQVKSLRCRDDRGLPAVKGVSFGVRAGEILSIAGVAGNGQKELIECLMGLRAPMSGSVSTLGVDTTRASPRALIKRGVAYVPADRVGRGALGDMSIEENLVLGSHFSSPFVGSWFLPLAVDWFLDRSEISRHADELIAEFEVKTPDRCVTAACLSGGNLQKMLLARELSRAPRLIICEEPTQGLDVGATEYVRKMLLAERSRGGGILLVSSDLDEVMSLSDRIAVLYEGEIVGVIDGDTVDVATIGELMAGTRVPSVGNRDLSAPRSAAL